MHGYLKVRPEKQNLELEELDLSDCEFIEDDEELRKLELILGTNHQCPRCEHITRTNNPYPYCSHCNWDSLTDLSFEFEKWAA